MELRSAEEELSALVQSYETLRRRLVQEDHSYFTLPEVESMEVTLDSEAQSYTELSELLQKIKEGAENMKIKAEKFSKRNAEKDPITSKPRFGEKTRQRVEIFLNTYQKLERAIQIAFENDHEADNVKVADRLKDLASQEQKVALELAEEEKQRLAREEAIRLAEEERKMEEIRKAREKARLEDELRIAEGVRLREEARNAERLARETADRADRQWVESIAVGEVGVREQLKILMESTSNDLTAQKTAMTSLRTIFSQIVSSPDDTNYRRIRRDHPKFEEDVGRHPGGKEILIAAGFVLGQVDEVPCFISKEPNIEQEMDAWSEWYELLKKTLQIIEEALTQIL